MKVFRKSLLGLALVIAVLFSFSGSAFAAGSYPEKAVELRAAGSPGGGLDLLARSIHQAIIKENLIDGTLIVSNQGGGGGNPARAYLKGKRGSGYTLLVESNRVYLAPIMGTTTMTIDDFTPVARIATEYLVAAVRADSKYKTWQDVVDVLKEDPRGVSIGVGTIPSDDQINILRAAQTSGIDPAAIKVVAFRSGGDLMTQLLGGHVDLISTGLSESLPQYKNRQIRILAGSSPERLGGDLKDMPTWKDNGIDVVVLHWRGVFGPPEMPKDAFNYWTKKLEEVVKTPTWQKILDRTKWYDAFVAGEDFRKELKSEAATVKDLLRKVGLVKD